MMPFESAPPEHQAALHNAIFGLQPAQGALNPPKPEIEAAPIHMRIMPHDIRSQIPHSLVGKSPLQSIGVKK